MNKGFSLVELIVVIAIMAVLAGVAVPVYSAYTNNAKEGVDENLFAEIYHAAEIEAAREGQIVTEVEIITTKNATTGVVTINSYNVLTKSVSADASATGSANTTVNTAITKMVPTGDTLQSSKYQDMTGGVQSSNGTTWEQYSAT